MRRFFNMRCAGSGGNGPLRRGEDEFLIEPRFGRCALGRKVVLVDLDVVNPYFRSSEYRDQLEAEGVRVVAPVFAERGSNLDVPSLTGAITPAIESAQRDAGSNCSELVIVDAGGDDAGATALARFAPVVKAAPYKLLYVVNPFRNLTQEPHEALEVLREIEAKCGLAVSAVVSSPASSWMAASRTAAAPEVSSVKPASTTSICPTIPDRRSRSSGHFQA